jgi:hypothetical protein
MNYARPESAVVSRGHEQSRQTMAMMISQAGTLAKRRQLRSRRPTAACRAGTNAIVVFSQRLGHADQLGWAPFNRAHLSHP